MTLFETPERKSSALDQSCQSVFLQNNSGSSNVKTGETSESDEEPSRASYDVCFHVSSIRSTVAMSACKQYGDYIVESTIVDTGSSRLSTKVYSR